MVFTPLLTGALLAIATVIARPAAPERIATARRNGPRSRSERDNVTPDYNSGWAGVSYNSPAGTYKAVEATFTVPHLSAPGDAPFYSAAVWVGLDGDSCRSALLQTGVDLSVQDGKPTYSSWYEWWPQDSAQFDNIEFDAGDEVRLWISAHSTTSGTATIENTTKDQRVTKDLTAGNSTQALCLQDAEWIVEDYSTYVDGGFELAPVSNFGEFVFRRAYATNWEGHRVGPRMGNLMDLEDGSTIYTSTSATDTEVIVTYV